MHVQTAQESTGTSHCYGVKQLCPLTEKLEHFDAMSDYPPDLLHDLFEGIVPKELFVHSCLNQGQIFHSHRAEQINQTVSI